MRGNVDESCNVDDLPCCSCSGVSSWDILIMPLSGTSSGGGWGCSSGCSSSSGGGGGKSASRSSSVSGCNDGHSAGGASAGIGGRSSDAGDSASWDGSVTASWGAAGNAFGGAGATPAERKCAVCNVRWAQHRNQTFAPLSVEFGNNISTLSQLHKFLALLALRLEDSRYLGQYHSYWWPGCLCPQDKSGQGTDYAG